jgi:hypothetical protein
MESIVKHGLLHAMIEAMEWLVLRHEEAPV